MSKSNKKIIGITLGDPGGIGPEVVAKALRSLRSPRLASLHRLVEYVIIGDQKMLSTYPKGRVNKACGKASLMYLQQAVELLKAKKIDALVTAPVCKEAVCMVQPSFQGHTEYLAQAFRAKNVGMMFVHDTLRTMIVTRHLALKDIPKQISGKNVYEAIALTHQSLNKIFKIQHPVIGVCGLNPHAGEGGRMGQEEIKIIIPAIRKAQRKKMKVKGPFAADTLFTPDRLKGLDAIVAMYHDQGLIPMKTLAFKKVVNLTVGLPFIRTSPAHGTAFDIAGKGVADPSSMIEAIKLAVQLSS
jgi:4-hydroxythreonine-4-phosphate dehydrogenase